MSLLRTPVASTKCVYPREFPLDNATWRFGRSMSMALTPSSRLMFFCEKKFSPRSGNGLGVPCGERKSLDNGGRWYGSPASSATIVICSVYPLPRSESATCSVLFMKQK